MSRACIPFHILFDQELSKNELIVYGMIEHMESDNKAVFFNNRTIAEKLGVSHESRIVGKMLIKLKDKGYITREHKEVSFKDNRGNITKQMRWCFSTVKSLVVSAQDDDQPGTAPLVPEVPPPLVGEVPPPLVPEVPPYNAPDLIPPLTTTTTSSSAVFNKEIDNEFIELRTKYLPKDERTPLLFLKQCKWHVDHGSKEHTFNQRIAGLKKILKGGIFDVPTGYPVIKKYNGINPDVIMSQYNHYVKSPIEIGLRQKGIAKLLSFEEWKNQQCIA